MLRSDNTPRGATTTVTRPEPGDLPRPPLSIDAIPRDVYTRFAMGHRSFTDAAGAVWNVWDVHPQWTERRSGEERRRSDDDPTVEPPVLERRAKRPDRRTGGADEGARIRIAEGLSRGWLAFESGSDKRRLAPIPIGWDQLSDRELEGLLAKATQAAARRRPIE